MMWAAQCGPTKPHDDVGSHCGQCTEAHDEDTGELGGSAPFCFCFLFVQYIFGPNLRRAIPPWVNIQYIIENVFNHHKGRQKMQDNDT